jgi:hypothetical protein
MPSHGFGDVSAAFPHSPSRGQSRRLGPARASSAPSFPRRPALTSHWRAPGELAYSAAIQSRTHAAARSLITTYKAGSTEGAGFGIWMWWAGYCGGSQTRPFPVVVADRSRPRSPQHGQRSVRRLCTGVSRVSGVSGVSGPVRCWSDPNLHTLFVSRYGGANWRGSLRLESTIQWQDR